MLSKQQGLDQGRPNRLMKSTIGRWLFGIFPESTRPSTQCFSMHNYYWLFSIQYTRSRSHHQEPRNHPQKASRGLTTARRRGRQKTLILQGWGGWVGRRARAPSTAQQFTGRRHDPFKMDFFCLSLLNIHLSKWIFSPCFCDYKSTMGLPGGAVVENLPASAGDTGSSPGLGRSHMLWSNWAREPQLLSLRVWSLCSATREAARVRGPRTAMKSGPRSPQLEKALSQKRRPNTAIKINK